MWDHTSVQKYFAGKVVSCFVVSSRSLWLVLLGISSGYCILNLVCSVDLDLDPTVNHWWSPTLKVLVCCVCMFCTCVEVC